MSSSSISVIEDEDHMLRRCPLGEDERNRLKKQLQKRTPLERHVEINNLNIAETYPKLSQMDANQSNVGDEEVQYIKMFTRSINNIYQLTLKHKKRK